MNALVTGGIAGFAATVPMTAAMEAMHDLLPPHEQYPLPPRQITEHVIEKAGVDDNLQEHEESALSMVNHFAYGAATGAIYAAGLKAIGAKPTAANGIIFGLGVWTASYQAWLPLAGILPPAHDQPARRNALMIAAHVVWGAALGLTLKKIDESKT